MFLSYHIYKIDASYFSCHSENCWVYKVFVATLMFKDVAENNKKWYPIQIIKSIGEDTDESACKHVVGQRCKQATMRWKKEGINSVLALRCLVKNGEWDRYWNQLPQAA